MIRRSLWAGVLTVLVVVLSACAGLPTSGEVFPGLSVSEDPGSPDFSFRPDSPQPGATPEQIVDGFIRAGSGTRGDWEVAREYLAPGTPWDPTTGVTVYTGDRRYATPSDDDVSLTVATVATVDAVGLYEEVDGAPTTVPFTVARQSDGEWRITQAPNGLVLGTDQFPTVFHRYALMYFDPTWQFLVPDVRWFPATNAAARITDALVDGTPAPWLASAVATAFPEGVVATPSVPVVDGVAQVELDATALAVDARTQSRMQAQLDASLATAGVTSVQISVGSTPLEVDAADTRATRVNPLPLVEQDGGAFGFLSGDQVDEIRGLSDTVAGVDAVAIQLGPDRDFAGARLADGEVVRLDVDGEVRVLDTRADLADPTVDPSGFTWTVPRGAPGDLLAYSAAGETFSIADAFPGAGSVQAISISHDGARLAAVVTVAGRSELWVAGIVRSVEGEPSRLGDPLRITAVAGAGVGIAWLDDITVAALVTGDEAPTTVEAVVGGATSSTTAPVGVVQIAGSNQATTVRLRGADGALYLKRGSAWTQTASGISVLATQQGSPR